MNRATRMMMISSLGDNERRVGFQSNEDRRMRYEGGEGRYEGNEGRYEGGEGRYEGNEGRYEDNENRYEGGEARRYRSRNAYEAWGANNEGRGRYAAQNGRGGEMERVRQERERSYQPRSEGGRAQSGGRMNGMQAKTGGEEDEMEGRFRPGKAQGSHQEEEKVSEDELKEWVEGMENSDGTTGPHYRLDQTNLLRASYCSQCDPTEFWAATNMMYSDYHEVARRLNVDKSEFYAWMAKAFLLDKDAGEGKLGKYMKYVAEK